MVSSCLPRPPDRRRGLAGEDQCPEWRVAPSHERSCHGPKMPERERMRRSCLPGRNGVLAHKRVTGDDRDHYPDWLALWRASPAVQEWSTATPLYPGGSRRTLADPFMWPDLG
jgi:hypothetical protein